MIASEPSPTEPAAGWYAVRRLADGHVFGVERSLDGFWLWPDSRRRIAVPAGFRIEDRLDELLALAAAVAALAADPQAWSAAG